MAKASTTAEQTEAVPERTIVYLGNRKTISIQAEERVPYPGKRCTTVRVRPDATLIDAVNEIVGAQGLWAAHSDADAPAWVAGEGPLGPALARILAEHYKCELREPDPDPEG